MEGDGSAYGNHDCKFHQCKISKQILDKNNFRCYVLFKHMNNCSYEQIKNWEEATMKKTYKIEVDCANCANKMEDAAKKTEGVKDATVNFMALKMHVEFEEGAEPKSVMQKVLENCKKVEDDCEIYL